MQLFSYKFGEDREYAGKSIFINFKKTFLSFPSKEKNGRATLACYICSSHPATSSIDGATSMLLVWARQCNMGRRTMGPNTYGAQSRVVVMQFYSLWIYEGRLEAHMVGWEQAMETWNLNGNNFLPVVGNVWQLSVPRLSFSKCVCRSLCLGHFYFLNKPE